MKIVFIDTVDEKKERKSRRQSTELSIFSSLFIIISHYGTSRSSPRVSYLNHFPSNYVLLFVQKHRFPDFGLNFTSRWYDSRKLVPNTFFVFEGELKFFSGATLSPHIILICLVWCVVAVILWH